MPIGPLPDHELRRLRKVLVAPQKWGTAKMTHRRLQNYVQAHLEHVNGSVTLESLPLKLTVEATNICNLRCVACPTGTERTGRQSGHMSTELFAWLMRELGPTLFEVELYNWGEPLLGRNVYRFIEEASRAGVSSTISTNFSIPFDAARAEQLVTAGLSVLSVSIDGATQKAYEQYRVRGDLKRVLDNCRLVADAKRRLGSETPELFFSFHAFAHNVHEVELCRTLAEELEMKFAVARGWVLGPEDEATRSFQYGWGKGYPDKCYFLWFQAVVHQDGGVAPCCGTFYAEDDFDRLRLEPDSLDSQRFRDVWNGPRFVAARRLFFERKGGEGERRLACYECPETVNFEGWKAAIRSGAKEFKPMSSNELFNYFWGRKPEEGPRLVQLKRRAGAR